MKAAIGLWMATALVAVPWAFAHEGDHVLLTNYPYDANFKAALDALDHGDVAALKALLEEHPELARQQVYTEENFEYDYFKGAMLLHHVAGNPYRGLLPTNMAEVAQVILDADAPVDAEVKGGTTLGLVASSKQAIQQELSVALIDTLLRNGADIHFKNGSILWLALIHQGEEPRQSEVAAMLVERGARVDLAYAAGMGRLDLMQPFFDEEGSLKRQAYGLYRPDADRLTGSEPKDILSEALFFSALHGRNQKVAALLLDKGADINALVSLNGNRSTPLHAAVSSGSPGMVELLISRGADLTIKDPVHNSDPLGWALYFGATNLVEVLVQHGAKVSIFDAARGGMLNAVKDRFKENPDSINHMDEWGTPLAQAAWHGRKDVVEYLLVRGADVNLTYEGGNTPLVNALNQHHDEIAEILRAHGGKEEGTIGEKNTPAEP